MSKTIPISIEDLRVCFEALDFRKGINKEKDQITVPHPKYSDDGHKVGLTYIRKTFGDSSYWELATPLKIVSNYIN